MKKIFTTIAQIVCYLLFYGILSVAGSFLINFLGMLVQNFTIFRIRFIYMSYETITQTLIPAFVGYAVAFLLLKIFKKGIYIWSFFIMAAIYAYLSIRNILDFISYFGLLTFETGVAVWVAAWVGIPMFYILYKKSGITFTQDSSDSNIKS